MVENVIGEGVFFDFLEKNLPEGFVGRYSDRAPVPKNYFICKAVTSPNKGLFGLSGGKVKLEPVAELKKFPGCRAKAGWDEDNDQQCLHIIVMDAEADDMLLDLADAFEDTFNLEAEIKDSRRLVERLNSERDSPLELL